RTAAQSGHSGGTCRLCRSVNCESLRFKAGMHRVSRARMTNLDRCKSELFGRVRRARASDARAIAELFQWAYEASSHECKEVDFVRHTLLGDDHMWIVWEERREIASVTCCRRIRWNNSYETCYSITKPEYRGQGLAKHLFLTELELAYRRDDCEVVV